MNILIILPAPIADLEAIRYWKARMTQQDRLYMMSLRGSKMRRIDGLDIHHLQVDSTKPRPLRSRVVRTVEVYESVCKFGGEREGGGKKWRSHLAENRRSRSG